MSSKYLAHKQSDADQNVEFEWFTCDYDAVVSVDKSDSWYQRLGGVASSIMVQWTRVRCGFTPPGGAHVLPSQSSLELILERIPTQPTSDGQYPPFPVADLPLQGWVPASDDTPPVSKEDILVDYIAKEQNIMMVGRGVVSNANLKAAVETGTQVAMVTNNIMQEASSQFPHPLFEPAVIPTVPAANSFRPAKMYAPELDAVEFALISGNTATKVAIARAYAQEELNGWVLWYDLCGRQIHYWRKTIKELEESETQLRESRENGMKFLKMLLDTKSELEGTQSRIEDAKKGSALAARHLARPSNPLTPGPGPSTPTQNPMYFRYCNI
jgi:hypothetical protein